VSVGYFFVTIYYIIKWSNNLMRGENLQAIWDALPEDHKQVIQARKNAILSEFGTEDPATINKTRRKSPRR
jgi:hypothetical protein